MLWNRLVLLVFNIYLYMVLVKQNCMFVTVENFQESDTFGFSGKCQVGLFGAETPLLTKSLVKL